MRLPFYNSKSATLALVVQGTGYFEMVCPHLSRHRQRQGQEEGSRGQGQEDQGAGSRVQGQEGQEEGSRGQGQEEGQEEGSGGKGQQERQEEGRRGQGQEKGQEEGSRGQGQQEGQEEGSRGQGQQEEGSRGQGQQEGQEEGSRGQGQEEGQEEGSRGQGQEEGKEEGSRGQGQGGQEREKQGGRGQGRGEEEREARVHYETVRGSLSPYTAHYVPPGHPFITVASEGEILQILYFELFAHGNQRNYLAGGNNILRNMGKQEAQLSYNSRSEETQEIFRAQRDIGFSEGPRQGRSDGGSQRAVESIMDFMSF